MRKLKADGYRMQDIHLPNAKLRVFTFRMFFLEENIRCYLQLRVSPRLNLKIHNKLLI